MTTQYTTILKLALPVQGELSGTWGDVVNDNITQMVEQAVAGKAVINTWTGNSHTLTTADGTTSESRCAILELTDSGTALTGAGTVVCPTNTKLYIVDNNTAEIVTVKTSGGTGVAVPVGKTMLVYCDGTNVVEGVTHANSLSLGTSTVTADKILDEDNMASDSATALATQQSIKAYVDSQVGTVDTLAEILANGNTTSGTDLAVSTGDDITFADSSKAIFGDGSDLQIYHDGSNSFIDDAGTGNLQIRGTQIKLQKYTGENMFVGISDGAASMYYDNAQKIATTATGIDVTGSVTADELTVDGDLAVSAANSRIRLFETDTTDLNTQLQNQAGDFNISRLDDDASASTLQFKIDHATGNVSIPNGDLDVTGSVTADGVQIGTTSDAYSAVFITSSTTGESELRMGDTDTDAGSIAYTNSDDTMTFRAAAGARMTLNSTGIDVTGSVTADGLTVDVNSGDVKFIDTGTAASDTPQILIGNGDTSARSGLIRNYNDATNFEIIASASTTSDKNLVFRTVDNASESRLKIANNGDISFYEDTGTTPKLFWDASAESLGIGTAPSSALHVKDSSEFLVNVAGNDSSTEFKSSLGNSWRIGNDSSLNAFAITQSASLTTDVRLFIANGGNVGIGTSSPDGALDIEKTVNTAWSSALRANAFLQISNPSATAGVYSGIELIATGTGSAGAAEIVCIDSGSGSGDLAFSTRNSSVWSEKVRILAGGNVGIGTSAPAYLLHLEDSDGADLALGNSTVSPSAGDYLGRIYALDSSDNFFAGINMLYHDADDGEIRFRVKTAGTNTDIMTLVDGSVGIGTDSPAYKLDVQGGAVSAGNGTIKTGISYDTVGRLGTFSNHALKLITNNTERMRIDASGNLLVGKSASNVATAGHELLDYGRAIHTANATTVQIVNRLGSDGDISIFQKDGTTVGSIESISGTDLSVESGGGVLYLGGNSGDAIRAINGLGSGQPRLDVTDDATTDLGASSSRFKDLYLSGGVYLGGTGADNKLEDYEEGTWTPAYTGTTGGAVTYLTQTGSYTKVGNLVTVIGELRAKRNTLSGNVEITGLPFTNSGNGAGLSVNFASGFATDMPNLTGYTTSTKIALRKNATNTASGTPVVNTDLADAATSQNYLYFSVTYLT